MGEGYERTKIMRILQKLQRLLYPCCRFVLALGVIVQSARCLALYLKAPTYTEVHSIPQMDADFPGITFCPLNAGWNATVLQVISTNHTIDYIYGYNINCKNAF